MLTYRATIPLSTRSLTRQSGLLRAHRAAIGSRWRPLDCSQQALLVMAHQRNGDTRARLAGGSVATLADEAYRGARGASGVPFYGRNLPQRMREVNAIGERAVATLKTWKLLAKLHRSETRDEISSVSARFDS